MKEKKYDLLIIKLGASGDVVRTTPILHLFRGKAIAWVTDPKNKELLPQNYQNMHIFSPEALPTTTSHLVLSLDEDKNAIALLERIQFDRLIGVYRASNGDYRYTPEMEEWFDMSLVSRYGKAEADRRKWQNRKTYPFYLFKALGATFQQEPYLINEKVVSEPKPKRIGIEARAGDRWPTKRWNQFDKLAQILQQQGFEVFFFQQRPTLIEYMKDIASCEFIFTGDTLCMHIALALRIPHIAFFTCTSPWEIEDYGIMYKLVSPQLEKAFYKTEYVPEAVESITLEMVLKAFWQHWQIHSKH